MTKYTLLLTVFSFLFLSMQIRAAEYPAELAAMVTLLQEVETMMQSGIYADDEFSPGVSSNSAASFSSTIRNKLRKAKSEYARLPRKIRLSKEADAQWYRMDALIKTSDGFSAALERHAKALAQQNIAKPAPASKDTATTPSVPAQRPAKPELTQAQIKAAERKQAAEAHAAAVRAQQEEIQARAAAVKAEKAAAAQAKANGVEASGPDWQNSYISNIKELETRDGFFQWPWSAPSWQAVMAKAASEQKNRKLGASQVKMFKDFILDKANQWPPVPKVDAAGDTQYALDMIRKRETADGLKIVDLWISRGNWKIKKNALGAIISRSKPGYLLYRDPSDQGCILKQLWISEDYAGNGSYEKASSWRYAKLRFQSCERR